MRRPLYGGERGIDSRQTPVSDTLRMTAKADFLHDFGEGVPERDKFTEEDVSRFFELAQSYGITKVGAITTSFQGVRGSNPYKLLNDVLPSKIYPVSTSPEGKYLDKRVALGNLGIDFETIKKKFKVEKDKGRGVESPIEIDPISFQIPGGGDRTYAVSSVIVKDKEGTGIQNIASRFELVTGGKKNIALVIDASGGLSMTSLINTDLVPLPNNKLTFYILENIENSADSATKLRNLTKPKVENLTKQPNVFFLEDVEQTVLYPKFDIGEPTSHGELLFGSADLVFSRVGDQVEANFTFEDGSTYDIENVSQNANVKNASLNLLASAIAEGGTLSNGRLSLPPQVRRPFLFPYIKRSGDWCQALSLLDTSRVYKKRTIDHNDTNETTTLSELSGPDTAIGLVTNDIILLGYALTIGIDVFFTTATDLRMLIYFRNTETNLTPEQIDTKIVELKGVFDGLSVGRDDVSEILDEGVAYIQSATDDIDYIQRLRGTMYRISSLRTEFESQKSRLKTIRTQVETVSPAEKIRLYFEGITILQKRNADEVHNNTQRQAFSSYPSLVEEKTTFTTARTKPDLRGVVSRLTVILSKELLKDAVQSKKVFESKGKSNQLLGMVTRTPQPQYAMPFKGLDEIRTLFGAPQLGGALSDVDSLRQFVVTPLEKEDYDTIIRSTDSMDVDADPLEDPIPLVLGSYYRDKGGLSYTVIDEYIITEDDLPVFKRIVETPSALSPIDQLFAGYRLMLLYSDILQGELERLVASEDDDEDGPSDVKRYGHQRIYYMISQLQALYSLDKSPTFLLSESFNEYEGLKLIDNEELGDVVLGRNAPREAKRPNAFEPIRPIPDYNRTFEKIKTFRETIAKDFIAPPSAPSPAPPPALGKRKRGGRKTRRTKKHL